MQDGNNISTSPDYNYPSQNNYDAESNKGFTFDDESIRKGFIRKVYSILMIQLSITFGFICLFVFVDAVDAWVLRNPWMFWLALGVLLVTMIAMACCEGVTRSVPMNYICLFLFTLAMSFFLGITSARFSAWEVLLGVGITITVVLALTLFAFQTKWDFTVLGGMAVVLMMVLLVFGIVVWFFPGRTMILVYACLGALLFSLFLVIDTQAVIGGKHKYQISSEEYVFAALTLYLDIINLFTFILTIIGVLNN